MSNGSVMSCENTQHGIFPYGRPKCECQKPPPYTHIWSQQSCSCEKGFSNPVCLSYSSKLTESVWSVSVAPGNASGGWLGHYRWTRKKVCFLTLVNQVNGPLGGRSRVPNGLIREEEVDDGNEQQGEGHRLTHLRLPPSALHYSSSSCQGHTNLLGASLVTYIQLAEHPLWLYKDRCEMCISCHCRLVWTTCDQNTWWESF